MVESALAVYVLGAMAMLGLGAWASYRIEHEAEREDLPRPPWSHRIASNLVLIAIAALWPLALLTLPMFVDRLHNRTRD